MSFGSKKKDKDKDKDKDSKGAAGGEASADYMVGGSTNTRDAQERRSTAADKVASREDSITARKEKTASSPPSPSQYETSTEPTVTTSSTTISKEVPNQYQYQYQQHYQQQAEEQEQQSGINKALDETRDNIRKSIDEARSQIPHYTQAANEYQEQTVQASKEIADSFLESQKEIINSLQSAWLPQIDTANRVFTSSWISPRYFTQLYTNMVSNFADNIVAATRLLNNMVFTNMEASRTTIQQARDNVKEFSRIAVSAARSLEHTARDTAADAHISGTYFPYTSSGSYSDRGVYSLNEEQEQQIPSRQNEEDTQRVLEAQNHIGGQGREQTVTDLPTAAAVGQALKDLRFPADKNRILQFMQEQSNTNPDCKKMTPLLDKIEDRKYQNVYDITKAAGLVE
jgi:Protein of unknown function (DUF2795)